MCSLVQSVVAIVLLIVVTSTANQSAKSDNHKHNLRVPNALCTRLDGRGDGSFFRRFCVCRPSLFCRLHIIYTIWNERALVLVLLPQNYIFVSGQTVAYVELRPMKWGANPKEWERRRIQLSLAKMIHKMKCKLLLRLRDLRRNERK